MKLRKLSAIFIAGVLFFTSAAAQADEEAYTIEVPQEVAITKSGWNELGSITVKYSGTTSFNTSKKLVVTAASTNNFSLASTTAGVTDTVSYSLATSENDTSAPTTFEFTAAEITTTGTSKPIGVIVTEYSEKSAGDYEDEITYKAEVQITVTWNNDDITGSGTTFTKDGVTVTAEMIDFDHKNFMGGGTFTTTLGNFTKIVVTADDVESIGDGWTINDGTATWEGTASNSVSFSDSIMGNGMGVKFTFTITPTSGE